MTEKPIIKIFQPFEQKIFILYLCQSTVPGSSRLATSSASRNSGPVQGQPGSTSMPALFVNRWADKRPPKTAQEGTRILDVLRQIVHTKLMHAFFKFYSLVLLTSQLKGVIKSEYIDHLAKLYYRKLLNKVILLIKCITIFIRYTKHFKNEKKKINIILY